MAQRHIWVMAPDGSNKRELTNDPAYRDERPRWSKDDAFILFGRLKDDRMQVWMMRADGSEQRLVAEDLSAAEAPTASPPLWFGYYGNLAWGQLYDWWNGKPAPKPEAYEAFHQPAAQRQQGQRHQDVGQGRGQTADAGPEGRQRTGAEKR
jgi:dipeptidyl aminopeptidase/acylaminoacyl peptidase